MGFNHSLLCVNTLIYEIYGLYDELLNNYNIYYNVRYTENDEK